MHLHVHTTYTCFKHVSTSSCPYYKGLGGHLSKEEDILVLGPWTEACHDLKDHIPFTILQIPRWFCNTGLMSTPYGSGLGSWSKLSSPPSVILQKIVVASQGGMHRVGRACWRQMPYE